MSPGSLGLPGLDHGRRATARTLAAVAERWPAIEASVEDGQPRAAIAAMEALAAEMRERTAGDPEPWHATLQAGRLVVYDDIVLLGRYADERVTARSALERCRTWDRELSAELDRAIAALDDRAFT
jgi:hypothetical protein